LRVAMDQTEKAGQTRRYIPCLEGIRGYGFLLVFCAHYFAPDQLARPGTLRLKALSAVTSVALFTVPAFFVLSGYLIGGILYDTRNREGFFRVFYARRILRVFPVYYLTLLVIGLYAAWRRIHIDLFWFHFLYIQNLLPSYIHRNAPVAMIHFWSLAVEEQFYLLWPLVVWFFPDRRKLIGIATSLVVFSFAARLAFPLIVSSPASIKYFTPTRVDAILLGVLLALFHDHALYHRAKPHAKWVVLFGMATVAVLTCVNEVPWLDSWTGEEITIPLVNITALALIVAVMDEDSWLNRICGQKWICWIGSLSYSLYVIHMTFLRFFMDSLTPRLAEHMRQSFALLLSGSIALCMTFILAIASYKVIERPAMDVKKRLRYGPANAPARAREMQEPALASSGS
jgi:peptidoglycan/LPS O-acetylase OafA/YrhL